MIVFLVTMVVTLPETEELLSDELPLDAELLDDELLVEELLVVEWSPKRSGIPPGKPGVCDVALLVVLPALVLVVDEADVMVELEPAKSRLTL